ncbi:unnamed protein product, partial [Hapterophycus canaliculatus]
DNAPAPPREVVLYFNLSVLLFCGTDLPLLHVRDSRRVLGLYFFDRVVRLKAGWVVEGEKRRLAACGCCCASLLCAGRAIFLPDVVRGCTGICVLFFVQVCSFLCVLPTPSLLVAPIGERSRWARKERIISAVCVSAATPCPKTPDQPKTPHQNM